MAYQRYKLSVTPQIDILSNRCSPLEQRNLTIVYIFQLEISSPWSAHPPTKCKKIQLRMQNYENPIQKTKIPHGLGSRSYTSVFHLGFGPDGMSIFVVSVSVSTTKLLLSSGILHFFVCFLK